MAERAASEIQEEEDLPEAIEEASDASYRELAGLEGPEAESIDEAAEVAAEEPSGEELEEDLSEDEEDESEQMRLDSPSEDGRRQLLVGREEHGGPRTVSQEDEEDEDDEDNADSETLDGASPQPAAEADPPAATQLEGDGRLSEGQRSTEEVTEEPRKQPTYTVNIHGSIVASPRRLAEVSEPILRDKDWALKGVGLSTGRSKAEVPVAEESKAGPLRYTININEAIVIPPGRLAEISDGQLRRKMTSGEWLGERTYARLRIRVGGKRITLYRGLGRATQSHRPYGVNIGLGSMGIEPGTPVEVEEASLVTPESFIQDLRRLHPQGIPVGEARINIVDRDTVHIEGPDWARALKPSNTSFVEGFNRNRLGLKMRISGIRGEAELIFYSDAGERAEVYLAQKRGAQLEDIRLQDGQLKLVYRKGPGRTRSHTITLDSVPRRVIKRVWGDGRIDLTRNELTTLTSRGAMQDVNQGHEGEKGAPNLLMVALEHNGKEYRIVRRLPRPTGKGMYPFTLHPIPAKPGDQIEVKSIGPVTIEYFVGKPARLETGEIWFSGKEHLQLNRYGRNYTIPSDNLEITYNPKQLSAGIKLNIGDTPFTLYPETKTIWATIGRHRYRVVDMEPVEGALRVTYQAGKARNTRPIELRGLFSGTARKEIELGLLDHGGFFTIEVRLGERFHRQYTEGSQTDQGDVGEEVVAESLRAVYGSRVRWIETTHGRTNRGMGDVEMNLDGSLYPAEVKAISYSPCDLEAAIYKVRDKLDEALQDLAKRLGEGRYRDSEHGYVGLALINPWDGRGEVVLLRARRGSKPVPDRILTSPQWLVKYLRERTSGEAPS